MTTGLLMLSSAEGRRLRSSLPASTRQALLARRAAAVADPVRLTIALLLSQREEICVTDLSWLSGQSVGVVSHHLKRLRETQLVDVRREHRTGYYRLTPAGRALVTSLLSTGSTPSD
jgi:DNA-binding transcriptional ArsR family regulator